MNTKSLILLLSLTSLCAWGQTEIQPQVKGMIIFNPSEIDNTSAPAISTNPDLSYQLLNNEHGVGSELVILKAEQAGTVTSPVTAGGMLQVDATTGQQNNN